MTLVRSLLLASFVLALPVPASATWPHDPGGAGVPIGTGASDQSSPAAVADGSGGVFIAFYDYRSGDADIYAQHLSAAGVPLWTVNGVLVSGATNSQTFPQVVLDGAGGVVIAWSDYRSGTSYDIYAQRLNAAGVPQWTANGVALCTATGDQYMGDEPIIADASGGAIVCWSDNRVPAADIYAQRISGAGTVQWAANGAVVCNAASFQQQPGIVTDGAGGAILTWNDSRPGNTNIFAQRFNAAGVSQWTANGVPLCFTTGGQGQPWIAADGSGGAWIAWTDGRSGNIDIYADRVNASGLVASTGNGFPVCVDPNPGVQSAPRVVADGAGGMIVAWNDYRYGNWDEFAQRFNASGTPLWNTNGNPVCTNGSDQYFPVVTSDGLGGAIIAWPDTRSGGANDAYAQRMTSTGVPAWAYDGLVVSAAPGGQYPLAIVPDGANGAIVAIQDSRNLGDDVYAQRVEKYGWIGNPEPSIASIKDVPFDQGGHIKVSWNAAYIDPDPYDVIDNYRLWRSVPPNFALAARTRATDADEAARNGGLLETTEGAAIYYWELVATQPAAQLPGYSLVSETLGDSVGAGNARTVFMIEARPASGPAHWFSTPDSGYSVDNLPPAIPAPLSGNYDGGATHLHWNRNAESDFVEYRLYRGTSAGFVPVPGNRIGVLPDTGYADPGAPGSWYKLSAVDTHGNESGYAILGPGQTIDVGGVALVFALAPPSPNPSRGAVHLRYMVPDAGPLTLEVYDLRGRKVRTIRSGPIEPGAYDERFDARDDDGRTLASGVYLVRLAARGRVLTRRLALLL